MFNTNHGLLWLIEKIILLKIIMGRIDLSKSSDLVSGRNR